MIYSKYIHTFLITFLLINITKNTYSQNLFNAENTAKYANHLFNTKQFSKAATQYKILTNIETENTFFKERLILSYTKSEQIFKAYNQIKTVFPDSQYTSDLIFSQYLKILLFTNKLSEAEQYLSGNFHFIENDKDEIISALKILTNKPEETIKICKNLQIKSQKLIKLENIATEQTKTKPFSPFWAATFSGIIPGTGKFYVKDYIDGFSAFSIVAVNAWQTYRIAKKNGTDNVYFYVFAFISAGFYAGNIYGSAIAAKRNNTYNENIIRKKVYEIMFSE